MNTVSIIIPLYNKAPYIAETLDSVLAQTHADWECLVVDNGSTDGSEKVVAEFGDPRIKSLSHTATQGPSAARNEGLRQATGEWVLFLDADDLIEPEHLATLLRVAGENPEATLIAGSWIEKGPDLKTPGQPMPLPSLDRLEAESIGAAPWAVHAAILKRTTAPFWAEELANFPGEDLNYWFAAVLRNRVAYSDSATALYRSDTPGCRSGRETVSHWFPGVDAALELNLQLAGTPSPAQCEMLVRAYQMLYRKAKRGDHAEYAAEALSKAKQWLKTRAAMEAPLPRSFRLRKWLGIPWFDRILQWAHPD